MGSRQFIRRISGAACPFLVLLAVALHPQPLPAASPCADKKIIGQEAWVHVEGLDLDFFALVDTGAATTSLHANDYLIRGESEDLAENVGKTVNFLTISGKGEYKRMDAEIARVQTVASAQGREKRYMVRLTLSAAGVRKSILVNLRDRSRMKHKLLLGRDWLADDFLVEVESAKESGDEE